MTVTIYAPNQEDFTFALKELKNYLGKLSGEKIAITNQKENATVQLQIKDDQQRLDHATFDQANGQCMIAGNRPIALLISIYQYLHALGVRFLRPGKNNEYLPAASKTIFERELHYDHVASYQHRGVCIEGADSVENVIDFIDWLPKNGFNSFFIQFENPYSFLKRWYTHQFNHYTHAESFTNSIAQKMSDQIDQEMTKRHLHQHRVGHGWTGEVLGYSSKYGWESGLKLPEDKKPLVAELNGKRDLIQGTPIFTNLDMSNPEVNQKMAQVIVNYAKKHPNVDYLHVWLSDGDNNVCECDKCQKEIPSDQYVRFLNYLDKQLTQAGLPTKICFLLYHELLFAPQHETISHPERFTMMFAPISRTFEKSYADVDYQHGIPKATPYVRNQTTLPNSLEANLAFLFDWQKMFKGDNFVYDYPLGRAHYGDLGYMEISRIISKDVKFLDHLHLKGYISCQELRAGLPTTFPNYVMGRTLWDKDLSYESLRDEYFEAAFGNGYQKVIAYLEAISQHSSSDYFNAIGPRKNAEFATRFSEIVTLTQTFLKTIMTELPKANEVQYHNWRILAYHRQVCQKLAQALAQQANGQSALAEATWQEFQDLIKLNEPHYQGELDVYRITEVATNYAGFHYRDEVK